MCQIINWMFVTLATIYYKTNLVSPSEPTGNYQYIFDEDFSLSPMNCQYINWEHPSCRRFDPGCTADGKIYKNKCFLKEALCNDSSLSVHRNGKDCLKGIFHNN